MSWTLLQRFIESDVFNSNPFLPVSYLTRYADHIGINYVLCDKLRQFPYENIEFFLPQICHLIISLDNESMALEEFLLDLCEESVTAALLTFWLFQTYLHDLSSNPQSEAFQTCRRVYNKVQHIVFGLPDTARYEKIRENILPVSVLSSFVLASIAVPILPQWAGPLAVAQARKPPKGEAAETRELTSITRSQTVRPITPRTKRNELARITSPSESTLSLPLSSTRSTHSRSASLALDTTPISTSTSATTMTATTATSPGAATPTSAVPTAAGDMSPSDPLKATKNLELALKEAHSSTTSLPLMADLRSPQPRPSPPLSAGMTMTPGVDALHRRHTHRSSFGKGRRTAHDLSGIQKTRLLRQHYFRSETQFLTALENISNRLVAVPKPARLSALRAELALIAQDLPAEIDIPVICPPTLVNGSPGKSKHHRIVRINPAEATVLNSAEKVPFLLMVEILRDDFTFDPDTPDNERLLSELMTEKGVKKRIFDLSEAPRVPMTTAPHEQVIDSVFEPASGDLGTSPISSTFGDDVHGTPRAAASTTSDVPPETPRSSGNSTSRSSSLSHPRNMPSTPLPVTVPVLRGHGIEPDFSALATHMRTASQMLAQLEMTTRKRPKHEVEAIRAKIIASMQSLEEQSFDINDEQGPTFDTIMAKSAVPVSVPVSASVGTAVAELDEEVEPADTARGEARMENDFKTGGIQTKGDRDDPSAAVFGEAWQTKKARIQKSSPYGWMKNWDLVSVIIKTGADLRQEAFACQLISACQKIWMDAKTKVWVKVMKILVTGESSGLIETITNGVSVHSIKRSLTLAMEPATPKRRIATLKDHFVKAFGPPKSKAYRAGVDAFKRSLAAYSVISYVFQLKDRHNGNILIDSEGHIIHIDFGFMLSNSPGSMGFEAAPCKLTQEYVEVLGGLDSKAYADYKKLCQQAFQALRRSADNIIDLVAMMGVESKMPCFAAGIGPVIASLRQRFQLQLSAEAAENFVETDIIGKSVGSYYTRLYDTFQYRTQGIY